MPYTQTVFQNGAGPDIDAVNLNKNEAATKVGYDHWESTGNPHGTTPADIGAATSSHVHDDRYFTEAESETNYKRTRGATAPSSPQFGWEWWDTSLTPAQLKQWTGSAWEVPQTSGAGGGGVSDHGALTGLGDDDHPLYALTDGTRLRAYRNTSSPSSPSAGQLWADTNTAAGILKNYNGSSFVTMLAEPVDASVTIAKAATDIAFVVICTAGTRPASPKEGLHIYETDTDKTYVNAGTSGAPVWRSPGSPREQLFGKNGGLTSGFIPLRWQAPAPVQIVYVRCSIDVASSSGSVVFSLYKALNAAPTTFSEMYTTTANRPTITATNYGVNATNMPDVATLSTGDYLKAYIQSPGTGAEYATVQVGYVVTG